MKEYIFVLEEPVGSKEIKILASGMMEAFNKAKEIRDKIVKNSKQNVEMIFERVRYID